MDRPRIYVDFNELIENELVLLSKTDTKQDSSGALITLHEGMQVFIYSDDDIGDDGKPDNLIAEGVDERNVRTDWSAVAKWCCRIDKAGIRHESEARLSHTDK